MEIDAIICGWERESQRGVANIQLLKKNRAWLNDFDEKRKKETGQEIWL